MNILVLSWRDPKHPLAGGAEQVMHEHMKGWVKYGHKVTLFSSRFKDCLKNEIIDGINIHRGGDQFIGVKVQAFFFWKNNKEKFDFVVDQFHGIPFFTPLYVKKPKLAVLQEVAREVWFLNDLPFPTNYIIGFLGYIIEPYIFYFYKKIHFMVGSLSAKEDLIKMSISENRVSVIPHGVVLKLPEILPQKEKIKTITFLGALAKDKGIEDALKTFYILSKKDNYNFWIIGKCGEEYMNRLLSLCEKYNLINKVIFWGFVSNSKKVNLLARSHILVNPSAREGWGLVNIEANLVGTPVIGYNSPGLVDSIKNNESGIICKINNPQNLANEIVDLLDNNEKYNKIQKTSIEWAKKFSWKNSVKKSSNLIDKISNED